MFKNKIKKEADTYQIKTTADTILNRFHETTNIVPNNKKTIWKPLLAFSLSFAFIGSFILFFNNTNDNSTSNTPIDHSLNKKYANIISLEVSGSLNLIEKYNSLTLISLSKNDINEDYFQDICNNFASNYHILNKSLSYKNNYEYNIEKDNFSINNSTYEYKITLENNKYLYYSSTIKTNDNRTKEIYTGILEMNDNYYPLSGTRKTNSNNNKDEIDISITLNNITTLNIEQETERSEYSYSYSIIKNNYEVYELEIDFEKDEIEMECMNNQKEYEYEITIANNSYSIEYQYSYLKNEIEGNMTLIIDDVSNEMTFEDKKNNLIYKIYQ